MNTVHVLLLIFLVSLFAGSGDRAGRHRDPADTFTLHRLGTVKKDAGRTFLEMNKNLVPALKGLDGFSHVWVFWWFDQNDTPERRSVLQVHPRGDDNNPLTGIFATRSPVRPNLIALTLARIVSVDGNVVEIESIDAFDGTPVIDLKPYLPGYDEPEEGAEVPGWVEGED